MTIGQRDGRERQRKEKKKGKKKKGGGGHESGLWASADDGHNRWFAFTSLGMRSLSTRGPGNVPFYFFLYFLRGLCSGVFVSSQGTEKKTIGTCVGSVKRDASNLSGTMWDNILSGVNSEYWVTQRQFHCLQICTPMHHVPQLILCRNTECRVANCKLQFAIYD